MQGQAEAGPSIDRLSIDRPACLLLAAGAPEFERAGSSEKIEPNLPAPSTFWRRPADRADWGQRTGRPIPWVCLR